MACKSIGLRNHGFDGSRRLGTELPRISSMLPMRSALPELAMANGGLAAFITSDEVGKAAEMS